MEPAEEGYGDDASVLGKAMAVLQGEEQALPQKARRSRVRVRHGVVADCRNRGTGREHVGDGSRREEVETLTAEGSNESLAESIGFWSSGWSLENLDASSSSTG